MASCSKDWVGSCTGVYFDKLLTLCSPACVLCLADIRPNTSQQGVLHAQGITFACVNAARSAEAEVDAKEEDGKSGEAAIGHLGTFAFR